MNKEVLTLQQCETNISRENVHVVIRLRALTDALERLLDELMAQKIVYDDEGILDPELVASFKEARKGKGISDKELCKRLGLKCTK